MKETTLQYHMSSLEHLFGIFTENSTEMVTAIGENGLVLFQNKHVQQVLGYQPHERLGQPYQNVFADEAERQLITNTINQAITQPGLPVTVHAWAHKKGGGRIITAATFCSHLNTEGINAIIINESVIVGGELAHQQLIQEEYVLNHVYEKVIRATQAADVGIWDWDLKANKLIWDDTMYRLYGLQRSQSGLNYDDFRSALHPDDRVRIDQEIKQALNNDSEYRSEFRMQRPDGSVHYTRVIGFIERDAGGKALRMGGTNWDITDQRLDERKLADANLKLTSLFNSVDEMLISVDMPSGQIIQISQACEKIYGYSPQEFYADKHLWYNSIYADDRVLVKNNSEKFRRNEPCHTQYRIIGKDGQIRWIEERLNPTRNANGRLIRIDGIMRDITDQKKAYEELIKSEHRYQLLVNGIDGIVWEADAKTFQFSFVSNAAERLLGYPVADWLGSPTFWRDHIHPDDRDYAVAYCINSTIEKRSHEFEYRMIAADGTVIWLRDIVSVILEDDEPAYLRGVMTDITGTKLSEQKVRETDRRYRQIVETAQEGIWTIDEYDKTNFVNQTICAMLEYSPEEMMGKELFDFMDEDGKAYAIACMERRRGGARENLDIRYQTKSGKDVWANISANPIFDEHGAYKGSLAMVTDITRRKLDEEVIKESEANLRTIFNNTESAYVMISAELKIVSFNHLAQAFSERENQKSLVNNASIMEYFTPTYQVFIKDALNRAMQGEMVNYETSRERPDGSVNWFDIRWVSVTNSDNKHIGFILSNKDITAKKLAALEREKIIADLIQRNKDQEQFTYIISHNLRAPVANIMGLTELIKDETMDPAERADLIDAVTISVNSLDNVIMDINHLLQVKEKLNEKKEAVYFNQLVNEIKVSISNTIAAENVVFNVDFAEAESLFTIRSYLYSIFYNLLLNSIKYRSPGLRPTISISSRLDDNRVELKFSDNGKGINMHKNGKHLFGLYRRFDSSVEGKGIGLYMVKAQVEALGGLISVKSELGTGTEFTISLPLS